MGYSRHPRCRHEVRHHEQFDFIGKASAVHYTENCGIGNDSEAIRFCEKANRAIDQTAAGDAEIIRMASVSLGSGMMRRKSSGRATIETMAQRETENCMSGRKKCSQIDRWWPRLRGVPGVTESSHLAELSLSLWYNCKTRRRVEVHDSLGLKKSTETGGCAVGPAGSKSEKVGAEREQSEDDGTEGSPRSGPRQYPAHFSGVFVIRILFSLSTVQYHRSSFSKTAILLDESRWSSQTRQGTLTRQKAKVVNTQLRRTIIAYSRVGSERTAEGTERREAFQPHSLPPPTTARFMRMWDPEIHQYALIAYLRFRTAVINTRSDGVGEKLDLEYDSNPAFHCPQNKYELR
ncbi:hypothetical protein ARMGADRAFT_1064242 [Armillaria gallica]|uniref:Uncharacterized protein n=1 Tax=Armillaria gallica TaxID=47427 RepID=A0A2H3DSM4_ARMGA|nr:hypothetical protein ARMGADRAFT_1064242 [Armillaria gallica]